MTLKFLSAIRSDGKLRWSIASSVAETLFHYSRSPLQFEPEEAQERFHVALVQALHSSANALDSVVYLRSQGWPHDSDMHQRMEYGHRAMQRDLEDIFSERCHAVGYRGPLPEPSTVVVEGKEYAALQVDELVPECCFLAVKIVNGGFDRFSRGGLILRKRSWLKIDSIAGPFDNREVAAEIRQDFKNNWRPHAESGYRAEVRFLDS